MQAQSGVGIHQVIGLTTGYFCILWEKSRILSTPLRGGQ